MEALALWLILATLWGVYILIGLGCVMYEDIIIKGRVDAKEIKVHMMFWPMYIGVMLLSETAERMPEFEE